VRLVRLSLKMLFTGQAGLDDTIGPVGIVQQMNETAQASASTLDALVNMLNFGAMIAVNLAVMNLLPIPALDGGRVLGLVLTTLFRKLTGREPNPNVEAWIHGIGMVLLLILMAVIMFKDIFVLFKG